MLFPQTRASGPDQKSVRQEVPHSLYSYRSLAAVAADLLSQLFQFRVDTVDIPVHHSQLAMKKKD